MTGPLLFSPIALRGVALKNRVVVAPMHQYSGVRGFPTPWHLMNAGRFAAGGAGLVFLESTKVERRGCGTVGDLGLWDDAFIDHFRPIAEFIRQHGAVPGIQLGHAGRRARLERPWEGGKPLAPSPEIADWEDWEIIGPSPISAGEGEPPPRALSTAVVQQAVAAWGDAARRAEAAEPHVECEALTKAWGVVYHDPAQHWDLYELAEKLIDFEDYFRRWRFNHVTTVERIIGLKRGTGGTSGVAYLKRMLEIELFPELWRVRTRM